VIVQVELNIWRKVRKCSASGGGQFGGLGVRRLGEPWAR
jgi:hypothetical protein